MTELVTKGIKISVKTVFEGTFLKNEFIHFDKYLIYLLFSYFDKLYIQAYDKEEEESQTTTILDSDGE